MEKAPVVRRGWGCPQAAPHSGQLPPSQVSAWEISSGRAHQCRVWFSLTITSKAKPWNLSCWWCSHRRWHRELSVPWLMGRCSTKGVGNTRWCWDVWKSSGETVLLCPLLISVVPQGAVRAVEASLSSSHLSNHIIQKRLGSRATVPGPRAPPLLCRAQALEPQAKPGCSVSAAPPCEVPKHSLYTCSTGLEVPLLRGGTIPPSPAWV